MGKKVGYKMCIQYKNTTEEMRKVSSNNKFLPFSQVVPLYRGPQSHTPP